MVRRLIWMLALTFVATAAGAASDPVPTAAQFPVLDVNRVDTFFPASLDLETLAAEDQLNDDLGLPPRFAVPEPVSLTPEKHGTWETLGNGNQLWRLRVLAREGATTLNFGFTRFQLPKTASLLIYAADGSAILPRAFTADDNESHGQLWTPVIRATDVVLELTVSAKEATQVALELGSINQGYRGFGVPGQYTRSGSCNLDVECLDAADGWRNTMRAVGVISTGGSTFCTGSLVNDTASDRKMYFMTANHCSITSANAASLVVYWNYQNSFCRTPGSAASGAVGDGTLTQFHTGSFFRAANAASDFTLVELDDPPVAAYNHHWAGWNRATGDFTCTAAAPCASIHHPSTDEKRITYVTVNTATTSYNTTTSPGDGSHIWAKWATDPPGPFTTPGVTEPGSSGSPLYDANRRFIGQLHGGPSACGATGNNLSDYYGRFSVSWTGGGTSSTRLSNWLDAGGTGATTTDGVDNAVTCTTPPNPTGLVTTTIAQDNIGLAWTATAGATGYQQLRSAINGGPYTLAATSIGNTASVTGLTCGTTYFFVVKATNGACVSGNSNQVSATTSACTCTNVTETEANNSRTAPQILSGNCNQISGTFLNDTATGQDDYFRISLPAGRTVTALLNGLSVDYDVYLYNSTTGAAVAQSLNGGTTADTASWTNTGAAAVNVYVRVYRFSSTRTTYQLRVSY